MKDFRDTSREEQQASSDHKHIYQSALAGLNEEMQYARSFFQNNGLNPSSRNNDTVTSSVSNDQSV
jgi:hypothetical protein